MNEHEIMGEIAALKSLLADTDYQIIKSLESLLACTTALEIVQAMAEISQDIKETARKRAAWRKQINDLEAGYDQSN